MGTLHKGLHGGAQPTLVVHAAPNMTGCFFNCTTKPDHSRIDLAKNLHVSIRSSEALSCTGISEGCAAEAGGGGKLEGMAESGPFDSVTLSISIPY